MSFRQLFIQDLETKKAQVKSGYYQYESDILVVFFQNLIDTISEYMMSTDEVEKMLNDKYGIELGKDYKIKPKTTHKPKIYHSEYENIYQNKSIKDLPGEKWKDVKGYEGIYMVSTYGRVKSLKNNPCILSQHHAGFGHLMLTLCADGKKNQVYVSNLVGECFLGHCDRRKKEVYAHINHCKTDNRVENLTIITKQGEKLLSWYDGLGNYDGLKGGMSKETQFVPTQKYIGTKEDGSEIEYLHSELKEKYGSGIRRIYRCITGTPDSKGYVPKTAYGMKWRTKKLDI